jgi:ferritin-like metal-binding protein YciE
MRTKETAQRNEVPKSVNAGKSGKPGMSDQKARSKNENPKHSSKEALGLRELFEDFLKDIYWAEKALVKAIPKMVGNATSEELIAALEDHLSVTQGQVSRLEEVFELLGKTARAKKCDAMEGLIKEAEGIMEETAAGVVRDAGIIAAGQKVEHYEIATYGTLCSFAKILGENDVATLLEESLNEEKEADSKLTEVAESSVNIAAVNGHEDDGMEMNEEGEKSGKGVKSV